VKGGNDVHAPWRRLPSVGTATKVVLLAASLLVGVAGAAYAAVQAAKPGITVQISPTSQSVARGQSTGFTVSITSIGGYAGAVTLSSKGLPTGSSATFSPGSVTPKADGSASSTMTVTTSATTPVGSYTLTVTGAGDKVSASVTAGLTVNYPLSGSLSMTATPSSVSVGAGSTAVYALQVTRTNLPGPVTFGVYSGLPTGATATFTPNPTTGNSSTVQIATAATTPDGTYPLNLVGSGADPSGRTQYAYASVQLVVDTSARPFTISGNLSGALSPGVSLPLNLTLSNPNKKPLSVTNLTVTVQNVTRTSSAVTRNLPCGTADYAVTQYSGPYPLTVPANGTVSLSSLGVPPLALPKVAMLDTGSNQDGCKGATLTLAYAGSGTGN
jgi:hypothetical protein